LDGEATRRASGNEEWNTVVTIGARCLEARRNGTSGSTWCGKPERF
jgi:hypothetical protein